MSDLLTKEDIKHILQERFKDDKYTTLSSLPSPFLFKDIKKATKRVAKAIKENEKITIVGDYDVDGVISSFILSDFLERFASNVEVIIPNRFDDGYGVSKDIIDRVTSKLVITVDNGISATEAAKVCKEKGIDLIITDHHTVPDEIPQAYAIINPKQKDCSFPFKEICGAQVAWYFIAAIKNEMRVEFNLLEYIDLLSIAIIADMMELREFNRALVKRGLKEINSSKRVAILAIKEQFQKDNFVSEDISYLLSPLLNSAGRLESALKAYNFLRSKTLSVARNHLLEIISLNEKRKEIEKELFEMSLDMVKDDDSIIIVWGEGWHEGVIGIVAARLARKFKKPSIVFSIHDGIAKGSARSIGEVDILSLIESANDMILKHGGHKGAAGLSLRAEDLYDFKTVLENAAKDISKELFVPKKEVLGEIDPRSIDFELLDILESFEPYGQNNPKPHFIIKNAVVKKARILGKEQNHQKLILESKNTVLESIDFNFSKKASIGSRIDTIFTISKNSYRGYVTPQLQIEDIISYK
jgi:single-stranded-DNA-specific exonuclease